MYGVRADVHSPKIHYVEVLTPNALNCYCIWLDIWLRIKVIKVK